MRRAAITAGVALLISGAGLPAQQSGFTRTPLQDQPLSIGGHHGVTARVDVAPGAESGRHTHPGEEFEYVIEGVLQLEIDGQAPRVYKAGEVFFVPGGVVHNGRNVGTSKTTIIGTFVVEIGKPLTTAVK